MMRSAIIVWLAACTAAAPVPNLDDDAGATSWGSLTVANLDLAIQEHHGRRRSELTAEELAATALPIIIRTSSVASAAAMCAEAPAYHCECLQQYHTVLVGLAVSCTLPDAERLLGPHNAEIVDMEASLELEVDAVQAGAPWGLDRIDQAALPLDSQYHHSSYTGASAGAGVKVFVVDTGVRCTHEDFGGRCIPGWQPSGPCNETDLTCATDNVHRHGTHVAGTVAGTVHGVAKAATVIAVQVMTSDGQIWLHNLEAAWDWVADEKAADPDTLMVFQMSIGRKARSDSNVYDVGFRAVVDAGIVAVQAAGNSDDDACFYPPRNAPAVIKVGATISADRRWQAGWGSSNYGDCVDIYAPGAVILSAHSGSDTATFTDQGTSMAVPHVSGVLAIMLSEDPTLTPAQATAALLAAALPDGTIADTKAPSVFLQAPFNMLYHAQGDIGPGRIVTGSTVGAGNIFGSPAPDHVYRFTVATAGAGYQLSTCGSGFDTWLRVFDVNGVEVEGGDDDGPCGTRTILDVAGLPAGEYFLVVDGYSNSQGTYVLAMTAGQGVFRGALSSGSTVSGDTSAAASFVGNAAPDHAYTITIPAGSSGAEYDIDTCGSGFDTYLRVFTDAGAEIASKDDGGCPGSLQQRLSVTLTAGTYTVVVDGYCTATPRAPTRSPCRAAGSSATPTAPRPFARAGATDSGRSGTCSAAPPGAAAAGSGPTTRSAFGPWREFPPK